ncbi:MULTISPECIES: hypothetical protein [Megamonas]|jgi:hypothetical protein|uniref:hypothetical protein n=1 Tax=Megamonas TaxID=158846 RepID=UPI0015F31A54|nr:MULTISPECIES: hypothetical protein [Megamonas]
MLDIQKEINNIDKIIQNLYEIKLELKILSFRHDDKFKERYLKHKLYKLGTLIEKEVRL